MLDRAVLAGELNGQAAALAALVGKLCDAEAAGLQLVLIVHDTEGNRVVGEAIDATREVIRELERARLNLHRLAQQAHDHDHATLNLEV